MGRVIDIWQVRIRVTKAQLFLLHVAIFVVAQLSRALPTAHQFVCTVHAEMVLELEVDDLPGMVVADPRQVILSRLDVLRAADVLDTSVVLLLQKHYQVSL